jgi:hypothetical protein
MVHNLILGENMPDSVSSEPFHVLAASLRESGFTIQGLHLEGILNGVYTTSSELISELGVAVLSIRKECKPLSAKQKALVKLCLREVRKAWPGFGLFSWFPFRR